MEAQKETLVGVKEMDPEKKFYLQAQRFLLTYKTHLDKIWLTDWFFTSLRPRGLEEVIIAHETGTSKVPYRHSHVLLLFNKKFQSRNCRIWDIGDLHPNIRYITHQRYLNNVYKYLCKEDHENDFLLERIKPCVAEAVWSKKTAKDVALMAERPADIFGLLELHRLRPKGEMRTPPITWHKWQHDLYLELEQKPDPRKVVWYSDPKGNTGKSQFCKYYHATRGCLWMTQFNGGRDSATVVSNSIEEGWDGRIVLVDLPRQAESHSIYGPLEMIKNGGITTLKYQGRTLYFDCPHLIVFANFPPDKSAMSEDRWDIREIKPDDLAVTGFPDPGDGSLVAPPGHNIKLLCPGGAGELAGARALAGARPPPPGAAPGISSEEERDSVEWIEVAGDSSPTWCSKCEDWFFPYCAKHIEEEIEEWERVKGEISADGLELNSDFEDLDGEERDSGYDLGPPPAEIRNGYRYQNGRVTPPDYSDDYFAE